MEWSIRLLGWRYYCRGARTRVVLGRDGNHYSHVFLGPAAPTYFNGFRITSFSPHPYKDILDDARACVDTVASWYRSTRTYPEGSPNEALWPDA